jgi:hypothetical protein
MAVENQENSCGKLVEYVRIFTANNKIYKNI